MASQRQHIVFPYIIPLTIIALNLLALDIFVITQFLNKKTVLGVTTETKTNKELFVPLGAGTTSSSEWTDVAGARAQVDSTLYAKIKKITFEVTIAQPVSSQQIWVRLYNVTAKHPVWYSEVTTDNSGPILLTSGNISLDSGNNLYQVQMKTQLSGLTTVTQSRIHIITN